MIKRMNSERGFTLIEILIASVIGAFVALVSVAALKSITTGREKVDKYSKAADELRYSEMRIRSDLKNFFRDEQWGAVKLTGEINSSTSSEFPTSSLTFHTVSRQKARYIQPEGDVYEVQYFVVQAMDEEDGMSTLMRRVCPKVPGLSEVGRDENVGMLHVISEDVYGFNVRYFDGEDWAEEWPEDMYELPRIVEVSLSTVVSGTTEMLTRKFYHRFPRYPDISQQSIEEYQEDLDALQDEFGDQGSSDTGTTGSTE